jgi:hypothetical protein
METRLGHPLFPPRSPRSYHGARAMCSRDVEFFPRI